MNGPRHPSPIHFTHLKIRFELIFHRKQTAFSFLFEFNKPTNKQIFNKIKIKIANKNLKIDIEICSGVFLKFPRKLNFRFQIYIHIRNIFNEPESCTKHFIRL